MVDMAHHRHHRRTGPQQRLVVGVLVVEVLGLELRFLLLARVHQPHFGTQFGHEQLDHVIAQRLGGGDHLSLLQEEPHDVSRRPVELRSDLLCG